MAKLSIIVLTYNSSVYIKNCIESILSFYKKEIDGGKFEIVVFDNNSDDDIKKKIEELKCKNLIFKKNEKNLGFASGINKAFEHSSGDYVLFLNPDTQVINEKIIDMIEFIEKNKKIGIIGGEIIDRDERKENSCGKFYNLLNLFLLSIGIENLLKVRFSPSKIKKVDYVSGGFMLVRRDVFKKLNGFDSEYFMYVEDMDLCFRALHIGFETFFFPYAKIKHYMHGSSNRSFAIENIYKGILLFYKKHKSSFEYFFAKKLLFSKAKLIILFGSLLGKKNLVSTYKKAISI